MYLCYKTRSNIKEIVDNIKNDYDNTLKLSHTTNLNVIYKWIINLGALNYMTFCKDHLIHTKLLLSSSM